MLLLLFIITIVVSIPIREPAVQKLAVELLSLSLGNARNFPDNMVYAERLDSKYQDLQEMLYQPPDQTRIGFANYTGFCGHTYYDTHFCELSFAVREVLPQVITPFRSDESQTLVEDMLMLVYKITRGYTDDCNLSI